MENITSIDKMFYSLSQTINTNKYYLFLIDVDQRTIRWNKGAVMFFGFEDEVVNYPFKEFTDKVVQEDRQKLSELLDHVMTMGASKYSMMFSVENEEGNVITFFFGIHELDDIHKSHMYTGVLETLGNVEHIDSLTGMWTTSVMIEHLKGYQENRHPFSMLQVGARNFDEINDRFGVLYGDRIIKNISLILMRILPNYVIYKSSGTKFVIVSKQYEPLKLEEIYKEIQDYFRWDYEYKGDVISIELSGAIIHCDDFDVDIDIDSLHCAMVSGYERSNKEYRGELVRVSFEDIIHVRDRLQLASILRNEINSGINNFYMVYQPFVDSNSEKVVGAEALARYHSKELGSISPAVFIPLLESDSVFYTLSKWITETSMKEMKPILQKYPDFILNINLSYAQLQRTDFIPVLEDMLQRTGFPTKNLCFELTERCRLLDENFLAKRMECLTNMGIHIALDDYGTGFSSLSLVQALPINVIKIDRGFIVDIETSKIQKILVESVCMMAHNLGMSVTVEGVETSEMKNLLNKYHVTTFQGYYYSKPLKIDDFMQWVACNLHKMQERNEHNK